MKVQRQTNIELCRLASILLVMLLHSTYMSLGTNVSFGIMLLEGFSIIGVNVFVLITGYFSVMPKKTTFINLAFFCLFWMIIRIVCRYVFGQEIGAKVLFFITSSNWFIVSYIGLLLLSPILNLFCDSVSKRMLWMVVALLICFEIWFDWLPPYPDVKIGAQKGYSVLSFAVLYLLARAIRLHGLPNWFNKKSPLIYLFCSIVLAAMLYWFAKMGHKSASAFRFVMAYENPLVILSSVAFLVSFVQMNLGDSGFINHLAKSTLACLFGHQAIFFLYKKQFLYLYTNYSGILVVAYWVLAVFLVFCASIAVDQLRLLLYKPIDGLLIKKIKNNTLFELSNGKGK